MFNSKLANAIGWELMCFTTFPLLFWEIWQCKIEQVDGTMSQ